MPTTETPHVAEIVRTPGVCGGVACVRQTRIPVWLLVRLKQLGRDEPGLLLDYPSLTVDDLNAAWSYHRRHVEEIEAAIADQERDDGGE